MATFKIHLPHPERVTLTDAQPIVIRLTHNRQHAYIPTGIQVTAKQIKKGEVSDPHILSVLNARIMRFNQYIVDVSDMLYFMSVGELKNILLERETAETRPKSATSDKGIDLIAFWQGEFMDTIKAEKTKNLYKTSLNRLISYIHHNELYTSYINLRFLLDYEAYLIKDGVGPRGLNCYMTHLKCVFNRAKDLYNDEDGNSTIIKNNPFAKYKMPQQPAAKREGDLNKAQLQAIIAYTPKTPKEEMAKDCFIMSLFLAGINSADLYNADTLSPEWVLDYERTKTKTRRSDHARQVITVPEYLRPLFKKYADRVGDNILNFNVRYCDVAAFNKAINQGLKTIGEAVGVPGLYYYQARHSFASIAHNELGFNLEDVGKCLTHVSSMKVTVGYVRMDYAIVDKINKAVMDWVLA